MESWCSKNN